MSGSMSQNKTDSANESHFNQSVFKQQVPYLKSLYQQAANTFGSSSANVNPTINNVNNTFDSANSVWNQQLKGGAYSNVDGGKIADSISASLDKPSNSSSIYAQVMGGQGNNYADAMKNTFMKDANRAQNMMLANMDARAAASNMSGGARHGVATGNSMYDINSKLQDNLAKVGYDTFDKDLQNKLDIAQMADSNTISRQQMLMDLLQGKNATINGSLANTGNMQNLGMTGLNVPWQLINNYKGALGAPLTLASGGSSGWATDRGFSGGGGM